MILIPGIKNWIMDILKDTERNLSMTDIMFAVNLEK